VALECNPTNITLFNYLYKKVEQNVFVVLYNPGLKSKKVHL